MTRQTALLSVALAAAPALSMAYVKEPPIKSLEELKRDAGADKTSVKVPAVASPEVVLQPDRPQARPIKTALEPDELERLLRLAKEVYGNTPEVGAKKSIGTLNVHSMTLHGDSRADGSLRLKSVVLRREFFSIPSGNPLATADVYEFTVLPGGRLEDNAWAEGRQYRTTAVVPITEEFVQDILYDELEFWLRGDGWCKTMNISCDLFKNGRRRP